MGASVSAPRDEYDDVVTRLLGEVIGRRPGEVDAQVVLTVLPTAWPELVAEVLEVCATYQRSTPGTG